MKIWLSRNKWLYLVGLLVAVAAIYQPGLSGSFFFDDRQNIVDNPSLRLFNGSFLSLISASLNGISSSLGRPISMATLALNLHYFGGAPFSFKLVNVLIHLANGLLVFVLTRQLWARLVGDKNSFLAPLWITAVWLLHPINLTPVLYVVQRMTTLAAFFMLAALVLYLRGRQTAGIKGWLSLATSILVCWPAAVLSKETGLLFPLFVLLYEWLVLRSFDSLSKKVRWGAVLIASLLAITVLTMKWDYITGGYVHRDFSLLERLMTQARVLWFYLLQLILPMPNLFSMYHDDISISRGLLSPPQTLFAIIGWICVAIIAACRHKQSPLFLFALFWFLAAHAIESTIFPLEIAFEHRNYLASIGILVWIANTLFSLQPTEKGWLPRIAIAISFVVFCGLITATRAIQWGDEVHRTLTDATTHPDSARANYEAGITLMERTFLIAKGGNPATYGAARHYLKRSAEINQRSVAPLIGLLYLDCQAGLAKDLTAQTRMFDRLASIPFVPADTTLVYSLSDLLVANRLCLSDAEVDQLLQAALSNPNAIGTIRGMIYAVAMDDAAARRKSLPLALGYAKAGVKSDPASVPLRINLIYLLIAAGDKSSAQQEFNALSIMPVSHQNEHTLIKLARQLADMESNENKR